MLSITRAVARVLWATLRWAGGVQGHTNPAVPTFRADAEGLRIQSQAGGVSAEYKAEGTFPATTFTPRFVALSDFERTAATR